MQSRLIIIQAIIDENQALEESIIAVTTAETNKTQAEVDTAQALVTDLKPGSEKDGLKLRLGALQVLIDATALKSEIENAANGAVIKLSKDINYDQVYLGSILVSKAITLDFNTYKIVVHENLFEIAATGNFTLKNAHIESGSNLIQFNRGFLTVESTYDEGIIIGQDFIDENYGSFIIKVGDFETENDFVNYSAEYASIIVWDGNFDIGYEFVDNNYGDLTIHNGMFKTVDELVDDNYGDVIINAGQFYGDSDFVEDNFGTFTINNGQFELKGDFVDDNHGNFTIYDGIFDIGMPTDEEEYYGSFVDDNYGVFTIHNGTFNVSKKFSDDNDGTFIIYNGQFDIGGIFADENNGAFTIFDGVFSIGGHFINENYGKVTIWEGLYTIDRKVVNDTYDGSKIFIHGGKFTGNIKVEEEIMYRRMKIDLVGLLELSLRSETVLSGGLFINANGQPVFLIDDQAQLIIADGYYAIPEETWLESSRVEVLPEKTEESIIAYEEIAFTVERVDDPTLKKGIEQIVRAGVVGQNEITTTIVYFKGIEDSRIVTKKVVKDPINMVIKVGTKEAPTEKPAVTPEKESEVKSGEKPVQSKVPKTAISNSVFIYTSTLMASLGGWLVLRKKSKFS